MDHVIESMKDWRRTFDDVGDPRALECIGNAIAELEKYFTGDSDEHYFTFGQAHKYSGHHQVIFSDSPEAAEEKMFEVYGRNWAFQYTKKQWEQQKAKGSFLNSEPLEPIHCK